MDDSPCRLALLVDPDDDTRQMYARYLQSCGYEAEHAVDGPEALAKAIARRPAVVITETRLLGMSGYDLCVLLGTDTATSTIPVVIVTGDPYAAEDINRAEHAGAAAVLVKPCLPETLVAEIDRVFARANGPSRSGSDDLAERAQKKLTKVTLSHAHRRHFTTMPPLTPPSVICPGCDKPLVYQRSHIGGVSAHHPEQWDYFECSAGCGTFQYRERTRRLRKMQ